MSLKVLKTEIADYNQIKSLFNRNKLSFMNRSSWVNIWQNPLIKKQKKKDLGWKFKVGKKIVGHIGFYPTVYYFKNKKINCSILHGWAVDKKYRSISIILLKKYLLQTKKDFFLGTTFNKYTAEIVKPFKILQVPVEGLNKTSLILINPLNFLNIYFLKKKFFLKKFILFTFSKILKLIFWKNINKWRSLKAKNIIKKYKRFDSNFVTFWSNYLKDNSNSLQISREAKWQDWLLKKKIVDNRVIIFACFKNNKILGYSALLIERKGKYKVGRLLDLIVLKKDKDIINDLIINNLNESCKKGCDYFEYRNTSISRLMNLKRFAAIEIKLNRNNFYYKSNNVKLSKIFSAGKNWDPCSLDGDILMR
jgi:hypothetical protein